MNGLADVISLDSHRSRLNRRVPQSAGDVTVATPASRGRRVALFCGALLALVAALVLIDQSALPHATAASASAIPQSVRQGLYQRTAADLGAACRGPEARTGLLRVHCVEQAKFLAALPECTADCVGLTESVLKPGR